MAMINSFPVLRATDSCVKTEYKALLLCVFTVHAIIIVHHGYISLFGFTNHFDPTFYHIFLLRAMAHLLRPLCYIVPPPPRAFSQAYPGHSNIYRTDQSSSNLNLSILSATNIATLHFVVNPNIIRQAVLVNGIRAMNVFYKVMKLAEWDWVIYGKRKGDERKELVLL